MTIFLFLAETARIGINIFYILLTSYFSHISSIISTFKIWCFETRDRKTHIFRMWLNFTSKAPPWTLSSYAGLSFFKQHWLLDTEYWLRVYDGLSFWQPHNIVVLHWIWKMYDIHVSIIVGWKLKLKSMSQPIRDIESKNSFEMEKYPSWKYNKRFSCWFHGLFCFHFPFFFCCSTTYCISVRFFRSIYTKC